MDLADDGQIRHWLLPNELSWSLSLLFYPQVIRLSWAQCRRNWGTRDFEAATCAGLGIMGLMQLTLSLILIMHYATSQKRDFRTITTSTLYEGIIIVPQAFTGALAQIFFLRRLRYLTASSNIVTFCFALLILATFIGGIGLAASVVIYGQAADAIVREAPWADIVLYGSLATDVMLSASLVWKLYKYRSRGSARVQHAVRRIIFLSMECAGCSAATSAVAAILYCSMNTSNNSFIIPFNLIPCVYALTVLSTLQVQDSIRKGLAIRSPPIPIGKIKVPPGEVEVEIRQKPKINARDPDPDRQQQSSLLAIHETDKIEIVPVLAYEPGTEVDDGGGDDDGDCGKGSKEDLCKV